MTFGSRAITSRLMPKADQVLLMDPAIRAKLLADLCAIYPVTEDVTDVLEALWCRVQPFFRVTNCDEVSASLAHIASTLEALSTDVSAVYTTLSAHPVDGFNAFDDDELQRVILYKAGV